MVYFVPGKGRNSIDNINFFLLVYLWYPFEKLIKVKQTNTQFSKQTTIEI